MSLMQGLPGCKSSRLAVFCHTMAACRRAIEQGNGATAASDHGAINAWRDDSGVLCANSCRFRAVVNEASFTSWKSLGVWWREHLKWTQTGTTSAEASK